MHLYFVLVPLILFCGKTNSIELDEDGFYDIVIAIDDKTLQNGKEDYIKNLKESVKDMGDAIWESTKKKFGLRNVDVLLPDHWETDEEENYATTQSYRTSDIRISHEYLIPQTINPIACGYPGNHIELPSSFFNEFDTGPYGPTGKALLALWARYRWGVHEEHGFPGDPEFPYYWRKMRLPDDPEDQKEEWVVSKCANAEIPGEFRKLNGQACGEEDEDDYTTTEVPSSTTSMPDDSSTTSLPEDELYPPPSDCLFFPQINQTATTSLMSFTFINTLKNFCDKETHDPRAPTRQNHFCWFKSIWDVILMSPDYLKLKEDNEIGDRPKVQFRFVKKTEKPLLYILVDGVNSAPLDVISGVSEGLEMIFEGTENWNVLTEVGVFPGENSVDSYDTLYSWELPWYNIGKLQTSFHEAFRSRKGFRTFGAAIHDVANKIKDKQHKAGAVLLIIKHGTEPENDEEGNPLENRKFFQAYEGEIVATVLEQNIRVFALEGKDEMISSSFPYRLKHICEVSGGEHFIIDDTDEDDNGGENGATESSIENNNSTVALAMSAINEALSSNSLPSKHYYVAHKTVQTPQIGSLDIPLQINYGGVKGIRFYFHQLTSEMAFTSMLPPTFTKGPVDNSQLPQFTEHIQWGKDEMGMKSYLALFEESIEEPSAWEYSINCGQLTCHFLMIAIVEVNEELPKPEISISFSTSADSDGSLVDLAVETAASLKGTPFSIYAKVEKNGHPINGPNLEVKANVIVFLQEAFDLDYGNVGDAFVLNLKDDGLGTPDITGNDGIFSGNFIPNPDYFGEEDTIFYQIFVTAEIKPTEEEEKHQSLLNDDEDLDTRLLPTRCGSGWGGCWSETVEEPFMVFSDRQKRLQFKGIRDYDTLASSFRVHDLRIIPAVDETGARKEDRYSLTWTEPFIPRTPDAEGRVDLDAVYYTENIYHIVDETQNEFLTEVLERPERLLPGVTNTFEFPEIIEPGKKYYFVVKAWGTDKVVKPAFSNIAFLHASSDFVTPTTTPRTNPTEPASTPSTSGLPPSSPKTTTPPSRTTTPASTTPTTTWATRPTTTPTTTTPTPSTPSTTTREPIITKRAKQWYQTTGATATFSVIGSLLVILLAGFFIYFRFFKRDDREYHHIIE